MSVSTGLHDGFAVDVILRLRHGAVAVGVLDFPAFLIVAEGLGIAALAGDGADFPLTVIGVADGVAVGVTNSIDTKDYFLLISIFNENKTKKKIKKL